MKTTTQKTTALSTLIALLLSIWAFAQVSPGQVDDFENGTTENWTDGGSSVPPVNISSGGPAGANDNYLRNVSLGGNGPGSRQVMFNTQQWNGNYTAQGIIGIRFHARAIGQNLNLRIAFDGGGDRICTINSVLIPAGGSWQQYVIPIDVADFTTVAGGTSVPLTLADVTDMRILSNTSPAWQGEPIAATLEIDNIEATNTLSTDEFSLGSMFSIVPNILNDKLRIDLADQVQNQEAVIKIYDPAGRLILETRIRKAFEFEIPVIEWERGVYLVKLTSGKMEQTERFIKQ